MKLKEARRRAGLGRVKAAKLSGVDASSIFRYETGRRVPGIENATRIARALGVGTGEVDEFRPALEEAEAAGIFAEGRSEGDTHER